MYVAMQTMYQQPEMPINHEETRATARTAGLFGLLKFRLTGLFLVVASLIFVGVAIAINISTARSEEERIIAATAVESVRDAKVVAGIVIDSLDSADSAILPSVAPVTEELSSGVIADFLGESDIVRLNLYLPDGSVAWSSMPGQSDIDLRQSPIFESSLYGAIASGLIREVQIVNPDGTPFMADVVETFIPISDFDSGSTALILGVTRDVSRQLKESTGQARSAIFRSTMISLAVGFVILIVAVFFADVRMWRHRETAIAHEKELASQQLSVAKLNMANSQLRQINDDRENFLSAVSNELKTPLTSIIAFTDIVSRNQQGSMKDRNIEHLGVVSKSGNHLLALINDLLNFDQSKSGETQIKREPFSMADLYSDLQDSMAPILNAKRQTLIVNNSEDGEVVRLDRRRILQAMMNLVSNGSKFSPVETTITVESQITDNNLQITVADQGIGISERDQAQLFTHFFRVHHQPSHGQSGNGLGLSITRDIIEAHGGTITVQGRVGEGTRFIVTVPTGVKTQST